MAMAFNISCVRRREIFLTDQLQLMNLIKLNCSNTHVDLGYHFGVSIETVMLTGPTIKFHTDTPSRPATTYDSLELSCHLI